MSFLVSPASPAPDQVRELSCREAVDSYGDAQLASFACQKPIQVSVNSNSVTIHEEGYEREIGLTFILAGSED